MERPAYYSIIPANVRYDPDLTANAKLLYGEITALANKEGYCWASNNYFANLYGISKESVKRYIKQLKDSGYVIVKIIKDGEEIKERRIYIVDTLGSEITPPRVKNDHTPRVKNDPHNITSSNITFNKDIVGKVVSYLNAKTGQSYRTSARGTQRHINARLNEGFVLEDFYAVIDSCNVMWGRDDKMRRYLRPETLFGTKFEGYLQAARSTAPKRMDYDEEGWL